MGLQVFRHFEEMLKIMGELMVRCSFFLSFLVDLSSPFS
jgi:hypothetical protein